VSVAGAQVEARLARAARAAFDIKAHFVRSSRRLAGVSTQYKEPWRLGVDRLVAVIGGHHLVPSRAVCVVDIGTALTLDLVDARGVHRGGAIVPGPRLMVDSLLKDTSGIRRRASGRAAGRSLFARDTRAAVEQGVRYATAAVVDRAFAEARIALGETPVVLLTGGAAPDVQRLIRARHRLVPDLVLRGLIPLI
jgi:type III pantothenate kinase